MNEFGTQIAFSSNFFLNIFFSNGSAGIYHDGLFNVRTMSQQCTSGEVVFIEKMKQLSKPLVELV